MKVEEKNESDLKQDQSNNPQSKKDTGVVIEKDKIQDEKNKEAEGLEKAVQDVLDEGLRTKDILSKGMKEVSTVEMGAAIISKLK